MLIYSEFWGYVTLVGLDLGLLPVDHEKAIEDRFDSEEALFEAAEQYLDRSR